MRALAMSVMLTGAAAATCHLHDIDISQSSSYLRHVRSWDGAESHDLTRRLSRQGNPISNHSDLTRRSSIDQDKMRQQDSGTTSSSLSTIDGGNEELAADGSKPLEILEKGLPLGRTTDPQLGISPRPHSYRTKAIISKVKDLDKKISQVRDRLEGQMVTVRNIAVLTPFQKTTRDRLTSSMVHLVGKISLLRLDLTRLSCYRDILIRDLTAEAENDKTTENMTLESAVATVKIESNTVPIPTMVFSIPDDGIAIPTSSRSQSLPNRLSREPSTSSVNSFYSAFDFGPDWPSTDNLSSTLFGSSDLVFGTPEETGRSSSSSYPFPETCKPMSTSSPSLINSNGTSQNIGSVNKVVAEEAEVWNQTKAANRVSLVHLPPEISLPNLVDSQMRTTRTIVE